MSRARSADEPWIQAHGGRAFFPLDPRPEDITIENIAHALSNLCRFGGHSTEFYSVAQHSVIVSLVCDPHDALWGLLHDASEAYLVDVPRPIKHLPEMAPYREIEKRIQSTICDRFGLAREMPASVRRADEVALATEKRDLMHREPRPWLPLPDPLPDVIVPAEPTFAMDMFIARYEALTGTAVDL